MRTSFIIDGTAHMPMLRARHCPVPHGFFGKPAPGLFSASADKNHQETFFAPKDIADYYKQAITTAYPGMIVDRAAHLKQVHGCDVISISRHAQSYALPRRLDTDAADGLVTDIPGAILTIATADCLPGMLYAEDGRIVGAFHAGWRGACKGVALRTLSALRELNAGTNTPVYAMIGPCIRRESFEIQDDFIDEIIGYGIDPTAYVHVMCDDDGRTERRFFDVAALVRDQLLSAGIRADHITDCGIDTYPPASGYFSFRRITHEKSRYLFHNYAWISPIAVS